MFLDYYVCIVLPAFMCVYASRACWVLVKARRAADTLELELQKVEHHCWWALGTKLESSERAGYAETSPVPVSLF